MILLNSFDQVIPRPVKEFAVNDVIMVKLTVIFTKIPSVDPFDASFFWVFGVKVSTYGRIHFLQ